MKYFKNTLVGLFTGAINGGIFYWLTHNVDLFMAVFFICWLIKEESEDLKDRLE